MHQSPTKIGPFELVGSLGKGGMGEVFLGRDPSCGRLIAIKRIRPDLAKHKVMHERFLREAKIAAQLTHPSIIPIYAICDSAESSYYTMPYVEGETLKEILLTTRQQEKKGEPQHPVGSSVPALMRIFLHICQAIAYVHSRGVLHRDLKPENIIIGKYGEVVILDWGLADFLGKNGDDLPAPAIEHTHPEITGPGKIPGTLVYMEPERAQGERPSLLTDIYALGVILYQLLTLRLPFHRTTLPEFRKQMAREEILDPVEASPYRDIPLQLAAIAKKCLSPKKEDRYQKVTDLIEELQNYSEGRPEWIPAAELNLGQKADWEFEENILVAKHLAITRQPDVMEWVNLMISKGSFPGNIRMETKISLGASGRGVGILLCVPERSERVGLNEGYSFWLSAEEEASSRLFRSGIEVMALPGVVLKRGQQHTLCIEKFDNNVRLFLDGKLQMHYLSHRPVIGTHVGLLLRDADLQMEALKIFVGSLSVEVNCLAVPDAFLANRLYGKALSEYRRIGYCFPGRAEGREALFRAGVTLLEEATSETRKTRKKLLFSLALEEFSRLRTTPGAPLEYLGKSLVYKVWGEIEDEVKCLELALRKYPRHPLLPILTEEITFRLHESTAQDKVSAYHFALLALRQLPHIFSTQDGQKLLESLKNHLEPLPFIDESADQIDFLANLSVQLAFWLAKPITLIEILESHPPKEIADNALFALLYLGCTALAKEHLPPDSPLLMVDESPKKALENFFAIYPTPRGFSEQRACRYLFRKILDRQRSSLLLPYLKVIEESGMDDLIATVLLHEKKWEAASALFSRYSLSELSNPYSPLFTLYGCLLRKLEGKKASLDHFSSIDELSYLPTSALLAFFLKGKIDFKKGWSRRAFYWKKVQLLRQLSLFLHSAQSPDRSVWQKRLNQELKYVSKTYPAF
ncbi:MAG: protein kinase [Chlamydiales bacterium]|nr:protein kinase [Chlamydiales bacterium]